MGAKASLILGKTIKEASRMLFRHSARLSICQFIGLSASSLLLSGRGATRCTVAESALKSSVKLAEIIDESMLESPFAGC